MYFIWNFLFALVPIKTLRGCRGADTLLYVMHPAAWGCSAHTGSSLAVQALDRASEFWKTLSIGGIRCSPGEAWCIWVPALLPLLKGLQHPKAFSWFCHCSFIFFFFLLKSFNSALPNPLPRLTSAAPSRRHTPPRLPPLPGRRQRTCHSQASARHSPSDLRPPPAARPPPAPCGESSRQRPRGPARPWVTSTAGRARRAPRWLSAFRSRLSLVSSRSHEQLLLRSPFPARLGGVASSSQLRAARPGKRSGAQGGAAPPALRPSRGALRGGQLHAALGVLPAPGGAGERRREPRLLFRVYLAVPPPDSARNALKWGPALHGPPTGRLPTPGPASRRSVPGRGLAGAAGTSAGGWRPGRDARLAVAVARWLVVGSVCATRTCVTDGSDLYFVQQPVFIRTEPLSSLGTVSGISRKKKFTCQPLVFHWPTLYVVSKQFKHSILSWCTV